MVREEQAGERLSRMEKHLLRFAYRQQDPITDFVSRRGALESYFNESAGLSRRPKTVVKNKIAERSSDSLQVSIILRLTLRQLGSLSMRRYYGQG